MPKRFLARTVFASQLLVWGLVAGLPLARLGHGAEAARPSSQDTAASTAAAWQRLNAWLGTGRNGDAWRRYLHADKLESQLARGPEAEAGPLREVLARFESSAAGLEQAPFVAVRDAVAQWAERLQPTKRSDLPATIRAAKGQFRAPAAGSWEARREAVRAQAAALDQYLARGGPAYQQAWHVYLNWDVLESQLAAETPNLAQLNTVLQQLYAFQAGLELPVFSDLRDSLHNFMNATVVRNTPNIAQQYDEQLEQLAANVEAQLTEPDPARASAIGRAVGWLHSAGQAPRIQRLVRRSFAQPNFYASVSGAFAAQGINDTVDETMTIEDCILGTSLYGTARTLANVQLALLPNPHQAEFALLFHGTAYSKNVGTQRGVTIHSTGQTRLNAQKNILFDAGGLGSLPASARASTNSQINDIQHRLRIVRRLAWKQAGKQQPQAEAVASRHAAGRLETQFDGRAEEMLVDPRQRYLEYFRRPLLRRGQFPELMHVSTTPDRILLRILQASDFQIGAPSAPPELPGGHDLTVRLHESFVGNMSEALLAGFHLSDEKLVEALIEAEREVPDELKIEPNKDPWSITFADLQPVRVELRDQTVRIIIRGKRFTRGDQRVNDEMEISAVYTLTRTPTGAKLTREGEVQAEYTKQGFENAVKIAVKTLMRKKFSALFKEEFIGEGLQLEGRWGAGQVLRLKQLEVDRGWLAGGWTAEAGSAPATAATPPPAPTAADTAQAN